MESPRPLGEHAWKAAGEALDAAREGRGSVVLFDGPAWVGKSALMAAVRSQAAEAGMEVLAATGRRDERDFAFGVVLQLLEPRLSLGDAELKPTVGVLHDLYRVCADLASAAPLAILVDDADLADHESIRFLVHLARRIDEQPVALLVAGGSAPPSQTAELLELVEGTAASARCRLAPLDFEGTAERVRARWPEASEDALREIHEQSAGYPVVADALAVTRGRTPGDAVTALASRVLRRARQLHEDAPALLRATALLGPGCRLRHAAKLADVDPEAAAGISDRLAEAGILRAGEPLSFEQPVMADAIAALQAPGERSGGHLRAARLLHADGASADDVAFHLLTATQTGSKWAVDALWEAAAEALGRGAPGRAVRFLRRALDEPPTASRHPQIVLALGHAEALAREPEAADRPSEEAVEHAARAQQEPSAALATGRALFALGETDRAIEVFDRAIEEAAPDPDLAGLIQADRVAAHWLTRLPNGVRAASRVPPGSAETAAERALLALDAIDAAVRGEHCGEVRGLAVRALADGALLDDEPGDGMAFYLAAAALAIAEDLKGAEAALTAALDDARSRGSVLGFATASAVRGMTLLLAGRVLDAASDARNGIAAESHGWRLALADARVVLAHSLVETGGLAGAERQLKLADAAMPEGHPSRMLLLTARGRVESLNGDTEGALASFLAAGELAEKAGAANPALSPWRSGAGVAAATLGDRTEGERLVAAELSLAESFGAPGPIGRALRALASIGPPGEALGTLEAAVETLDGSQAALERARALVGFGAALRRSGRRREARTPLRAGLEIAQRCGAEVLGVRAMQELTAAGARPRRTALTGVSSLTVRERQVASLAAEGLSNREIAETLVVTVKTVEWHLRHTYRKLGLDSRRRLGEFFPRAKADRPSLPPR